MLTKEDFKDREGNQIQENTLYYDSLQDEYIFMTNFEIDESRKHREKAFWKAIDQYGSTELNPSGINGTDYKLKIVQDPDYEIKCLEGRIKKLQGNKGLILKQKK